MILVIGPLASGKRSFVRSLGFSDSDMDGRPEAPCPVLLDAHEAVRDPTLDVASVAEQIAGSKEVVCMVEVGSGIVPIDAQERAWRERAGRLSQELAVAASTVVRVICGIPQAIKGELPKAGGRYAGASFYANRSCPYFPCHEGVDEGEFNCLFCYCPLYALGPRCGGDFSYTPEGRKDCSACTLLHVRDEGAKIVAKRYGELAALAAPAPAQDD